MKKWIRASLGLAIFLLTACRPTVNPTPTLVPTPTPVPVTSPAYEVAEAFLDAWATGDYEAMYAHCSVETQKRIPLAEFQRIYAEIIQESTILTVQPTLVAVLEEGPVAQAAFSAVIQTSFVGTFTIENELPLVWDTDRWAVDWSKTCIFRELETENLVYMDPRSPVRANIYDINGKGLAVKKELITVSVIPGDIVDEPALLARLAKVLDMPQPEIKAKYENQPPTWLIPIADISLERSQEYYELLDSEPGISLNQKSVRSYRDPVAAPHIVGYMGNIPADELPYWQEQGYTGDELVGRTGIEAWGEHYLGGQRGGVLTIITPEGQTVTTLARREAVPARSVYLTIDYAFQRQVEDLLGERKGAVVVMDVNDGRVLALATWPRFDPNLFAEGIDPTTWSALVNDPNNPLLNRPVQGQYPPGSTFKIITMGTIMERGGVSPTQGYYCPGTWNKLGWDMTCWLKSGHGNIDLVNALTASCDVTFYQIGYDLSFIDIDALPSYARSFGLGAPTGIGNRPDKSITGSDPLGEPSALVPDDAWKRETYGEGWSTGDTVNLAIGQGFLLTTPLQMCRMVAAVGNGGTLYRPQIVYKVAAIGDQPEVSFKADKVGRLPITPATLQAIQEGLLGVTTKPQGTAPHRFVDFPYPVAGKTGTAQNEGELPHSWFIGYLPADNPEIAIAAMIENIGEGTTYAAPLFRQVAAAYYGIEQETQGTEGQGD
ncbi:MAG: penicillin-binding protein 2 [Anaerolineae bacterium]|nr:penicillin-binding protein 2 [Anaerolineae bacterium]